MSLGAPIVRRKDSIYIAVIDDEKKNAGWRQEFSGQQSLLLEDKQVEFINRLGLDKINRVIEESSLTSGSDLSRRTRLAVTWFGKSCNAETIAESFLDNAVSLEALLSQGRTPQQAYASEMAYLVIQESETGLYPMGQPISKQFSKRLLDGANYDERVKIVKNHAKALLKYRNNIIHGHIHFDLCDPLMQLDFEALVRNSILSFVYSEWKTINEFKTWIKSKEPTGYFFSVRKSILRLFNYFIKR